MTVVILVDRFDSSADLLVAELCRRSIRVLRLDPAEFPEQATVAAELSGPTWTGWIETGSERLDLASVTGVYYRRPAGFDSDFGLSGGDDPWSAAQARLALGGLVSAVGSWLNHPHRIAFAEYAPVQLRAAHEVGLLVPRTCVTNDPVAAHRFVVEVGCAVREPFRGHGIEDDDQDEEDTTVTAADPDHHIAAPVHRFRHHVPHDRAVRLAVVDSHFFAARIDRRRDPAISGHRSAGVPPAVRCAVSEFLHRFGIRFATFDFAVDGSDLWWFLRCDPNGRWARIEHEAGLPIAAALADVLG